MRSSSVRYGLAAHRPHQAGSSLVIINLPDPPVVAREADADPKRLAKVQLEQWVEYMDYMEGLAKNLPRVLYVHGAGQEVIQFE